METTIHKDLLLWFYANYYTKFIAYAFWKITHYHDAEDIVSEVFIHIMFNIDKIGERINNKEHMKAYLYRSINNECLDYLARKSNKLLLISYDTDVVQKFNVEDKVSDDTDIDIDSMLENVKGNTLYILERVYLHGETTAEVAGKLGIASQTALNLKSRAVERMRKKLGVKMVRTPMTDVAVYNARKKSWRKWYRNKNNP